MKRMLVWITVLLTMAITGAAASGTPEECLAQRYPQAQNVRLQQRGDTAAAVLAAEGAQVLCVMEKQNGRWMLTVDNPRALLQDEAELDEIVKLVGMDALNSHDRMKLEAARSIREDYLHQDAFHEVDTYASLEKQCAMMKLVLYYYDAAIAALDDGVSVLKLIDIPVRERIGRIKYVPEDKVCAESDEIIHELDKAIDDLKSSEEDE